MKLELRDYDFLSSRFLRTGSIRVLMTVGVGMTSILSAICANEINAFVAQPIRSHQVAVYDKTSAGRVCRVCYKWKPFESFHRNHSKLGGVETQCKSCVSKKKQQQRNKQRSPNDIELMVTFTRSSKAREAIDGILGLVCDEVVG